MPQVDRLLAVARALTRLCAYAYAPLAIELFCGRALGAWLRLAQRLLAAQPLAGRVHLAQRLLKDGLVPMVQAFGLVVPQARARSPLHPLSEHSVWCLLRRTAIKQVPFGAQVADMKGAIEGAVSACVSLVRFLLLPHPAIRKRW